MLSEALSKDEDCKIYGSDVRSLQGTIETNRTQQNYEDEIVGVVTIE